jgi:hypothetical protein
MRYNATLVASLTFATLMLLSPARSARADGWGWHPPEPACTNVASMNPNGLITQGKKPGGLLWHGAGCYSVTAPSSAHCDWKTSITEDHMLGKGRRLLIVTSRPASVDFGLFPETVVLAFMCESGHLKSVLHMRYPSAVKVELASRDRLRLRGRDSTGGGYAAARERRDVYRWNEAKDRYELKAATIWPLPYATATQR